MLPVSLAIGEINRRHGIGINRGKTRCLGWEFTIEPGLDPADNETKPPVLVCRDMIGDENIFDGDGRMPLGERNAAYLSNPVRGFRDTSWLIEAELEDEKPVPGTTLQLPHGAPFLRLLFT
jgi:hypothetical protein